MKKTFFAFLILGLASMACGSFSSPEIVKAPVTQAASTVASALTADQVKNAKYQLVAEDSHPTVQLADGTYQSTADVSSPHYMSINLAPQMAFGDLNSDGAGDAAVLLAENYGGSGVFVSLIAMLDQNGQPVQVASELIDDRPKINSVSIQNGEIFLDATIHGTNDPMCCATLSTQRTYKLSAGKLILTSFVSRTADGSKRAITISHPSNGDSFMNSWPLTVTGNVTIAPFENTLAYAIFDANNNQVDKGSLMVKSLQPGGPGFFSLPVDLSKIKVPGPVRIEVEDLSAADGSILALGSVTVNVK